MTFSEVLSWQQPKLSERSFQAQVLRYAALRHWRAYHTRDSRGSAAGFPDLVLVRRPRVVFAELKAQRTPVTDDQRAWIAELRACNQETFLWRPDDWEEIERCLS